MTLYDWSQATDETNGAIDPNINFAEFQNPQTLNNSARALMARVAELIADLAPKRSTTGTGNAYAITMDATGATYKDGEIYTGRIHSAPTGAATLDVNSRGAKAFRPVPGVEFAAGDMIDGQPFVAYYDLAQDTILVTNTGYHVRATASGVNLQAITATLPKIGDPVLSLDDVGPAAGRIRLTESTQSILKSTYPELDAWLSARSYPWGSTATHFSLPPAAGYLMRFAATGATIDPDGPRAAGSTQQDAIESHSHGVGTLAGSTSTDGDHTHSYDRDTGNAGAQFGANSYRTANTVTEATETAGAHSHTVSLTGSTAAQGGTETRGKNVAFHVDIVASNAAAAADTALFGFKYAWDSGTDAADPGAGRVRGNDATLASITQLYISNTDGWGVDVSSVIGAFVSSQALNLGLVTAPANRLRVTLSGTPTANSGYYAIPVTVDTAAGTISNNDNLALEVSGPPGPAGAAGAPMNWRGNWASSTSYAVGDGVANDGSSYLCIQAHTSSASDEPGTGVSWETYWDVAAAKGDPGTNGVDPGILLAWDDANDDSDPGAGEIKASVADLSTNGTLYINDADQSSNSIRTFLATLDDTDQRGTIYVTRTSDGAQAVLTVSGSVTQVTGYSKVPFTHVSGATAFAASDSVSFLFARAGNNGADGAGSGDVTAASAFGTDNLLIRSDGTAKGIQASGISIDDSDNMSGVASLSGLATPDAADKAANKSYVDSAIASLQSRYTVRVATVTNVTLSSGLENGDSIDGVTVATGDLVLVKDQSSAAQNGIYVVPASGAASRAAEFDTYDEHAGTAVFVQEGSSNADTMWLCTSNEGGTLDTTAITYSRVRIDIEIPVPITQGGTGATSAAAAFTALKQAASDTATGVVELATPAETTSGTDGARAVTPDGLAGSDFGKTIVSILVFDDSQDVATGDGAGDFFWRVPSTLNGFNLVSVAAAVETAGTTGTTDIQVHNVTQAADMLTTKVTIDSAETDSSTAATAAVIDAANDDVATGDKIRIDVDAVATTAPKGLLVELQFQLP